MAKLKDLFKQEFNRAPLWQKIILVVLISFAIFYFGLMPLINVSQKAVRELDETRDRQFKILQAAKYTIEDSQIISRNFDEAVRSVAENAWQAESIQQHLKNILTENSRQVYVISFPEEKQQKLKLLKIIILQARLRCSEKQALQILQKFSSIRYCDLLYIEYKDNILLLDAEILATIKQYTKKQAGPPPRKLNIKPEQPILNGFFSSRGKTRALINSRLYSIGDKLGSYTIISVDSKNKFVVLQGKTQQLIIRMSRRGR